jgi:hypothetical protein
MFGWLACGEGQHVNVSVGEARGYPHPWITRCVVYAKSTSAGAVIRTLGSRPYRTERALPRFGRYKRGEGTNTDPEQAQFCI